MRALSPMRRRGTCLHGTCKGEHAMRRLRNNSRRWFGVFTLALTLILHAGWACGVDFPGPEPGKAQGSVDETGFVLENNVLAYRWTATGNRFRPVSIVDKLSGTTVSFGEAECFRFSVARSPLAEWQVTRASQFKLARAPVLTEVKAATGSQRLADGIPGREIIVDLVSPDESLQVQWRAVLRDGANYVRQLVRIRGKREPQELGNLEVLELPVPKAEVAGSVDGSPVVAGHFFCGCEHPMSRNMVESADAAVGGQVVRCRYPYNLTAQPEEPVEMGCVIGVVPEGQLRRGFLHYLERERIQPYHPFLHHNCGYPIGCRYWGVRGHGTNEEWRQFVAEMDGLWVGLIDTFGRELVEKRGVILDSFVHDHGWDNTDAVWQFHEGYPHGFAAQQAAAEKYHSSVGVWLSPWGGYSGRNDRVQAGQKQGFETYKMGLSLAGPHYYARVRQACLGMVHNYGVNYFKFDGFGSGNSQDGAGAYSSEVESLLRLMDEIRGAKRDVFLNPTTGTWPSPFWLLWADAIWRQESDAGFLGKGSDRQQWLTYRDNATYHATIGRGPLYPISSLMLHGIMVHEFSFKDPYNPKATPVSCQEADVLAEIRSYFATGANLQELHIDPSLMSERTWDVLAESAKWSRNHADILADTHWVGGDPQKGEVYGWASWSKRKGVLALRNPADQPSQIRLDLGDAFELPVGAAQEYVLKSPWTEDAAKPEIRAVSGQPHTFNLQPLEVLVWDAAPTP